MAEIEQKTSSKKAMTWTDEHNEVLIREMFLFQPWNYKKGSQQRGHAWEMISDSLNDLNTPMFGVTQKSVRDHYTLLQKQQKRRLREEEKASGISPEPSEVEIAIEEMIELFRSRDDDDKVLEEKQKENSVAEVGKAVEMRQLSMETLAEREKESLKVKMKSDVDAQLKREELRLRQIEAEERKQQQNSVTSQQEALTKALTDSIAAQQRQQEQLMHQMQLQNTALLSLMQSITKKE
ncbi:Hypothetical predicted protein [Paramuricea clavata]|uniref:Uncharacterized protein n=1 Tax=Paramuricea clavata TaxID=317549 RepID=A0A7D9JBE5_PARCT|nr:Hypothetical predicted protein [Paramuricea clavata]